MYFGEVFKALNKKRVKYEVLLQKINLRIKNKESFGKKKKRW